MITSKLKAKAKGKYLYKRVLIKLSGEGVMGGGGKELDRILAEIKTLQKDGVKVALTVGGGNIARGADIPVKDKPIAHQIGMLAITINGLALLEKLNEKGIEAEMMSGIFMPEIAKPFTLYEGRKVFEDGKILVLVGGTGRPYFTSDTTACLRAAELKCDALIKMTQVDGIYTADPKKDKNAKRLAEVTYDEIEAKGLKVMDFAAASVARDGNVEILVSKTTQSLKNVLQGKGTYSIVRESKTRKSK